MRTRYRRIALAFGMLATGVALADERVDVRAISGVSRAMPGQQIDLALEFSIAPGWHLYWRNPGDSGQPPVATVDPEVGELAGPNWPVPELLPLGSLMNHGYSDTLFLPYQLRLPSTAKPGSTETVRVEVEWLACREACIPGHDTLDIPIAVAATSRPAHRRRFARARSRAPLPVDAVIVDDGGATWSLRMPNLPTTPVEPWFLAHDEGLILHAAPQTATLHDGVLTLEVARGDLAPPTVDHATGLLIGTTPRGRHIAWTLDAHRTDTRQGELP